MRDQRLSLALWVLGLLVALAVTAPWLSPTDPNEQLDPAAARFRPPGTQLYVIELSSRTLLADRVERVGDVVRYERLGAWQAAAASEVHNATPSGVDETRTYLLGTDRFGRDVLSRLLHGGRVSLRIGLLAVLLAAVLGVTGGLLAGLGGGFVDGLVMRVADGLMAFPRLFLVLAAAGVWAGSELLVVVIIGATGWMETARIVRSDAARLRDGEIVQAARGLGASPLWIARQHVLPLVAGPVLVATALQVGDVILTESALSFLGFGIQPPTASWGSMIADGQDALTTAWWAAVFPGLAIVVTVVSINLAADRLRTDVVRESDAS